MSLSLYKFFCDISFGFYDISDLFYDVFYDIFWCFYDMRIIFYDIHGIIEVPHGNMEFRSIGVELWSMIILQILKPLIFTYNLLHTTTSTLHKL